MRTFGMLVLIGVLGVPLVATAEEAAQQTSQERVRSMGRTWTGVALIGGGAFITAHAATSTCATTSFASALFNTQTCGQAWTKIGAGLGLATTGVLLATVWSDVPVMRNLTVAPTRGGVHFGASFGF